MFGEICKALYVQNFVFEKGVVYELFFVLPTLITKTRQLRLLAETRKFRYAETAELLKHSFGDTFEMPKMLKPSNMPKLPKS